MAHLSVTINKEVLLINSKLNLVHARKTRCHRTYKLIYISCLNNFPRKKINDT